MTDPLSEILSIIACIAARRDASPPPVEADSDLHRIIDQLDRLYTLPLELEARFHFWPREGDIARWKTPADIAATVRQMAPQREKADA